MPGCRIGKILKVAAQQRKLVDGFVGECAAQHIIRRGHDGRFFRNRDGFVDRARVQPEIDTNIFRHFELKPGALRPLKLGASAVTVYGPGSRFGAL